LNKVSVDKNLLSGGLFALLLILISGAVGFGVFWGAGVVEEGGFSKKESGPTEEEVRIERLNTEIEEKGFEAVMRDEAIPYYGEISKIEDDRVEIQTYNFQDVSGVILFLNLGEVSVSQREYSDATTFSERSLSLDNLVLGEKQPVLIYYNSKDSDLSKLILLDGNYNLDEKLFSTLK